MRNKNLRPTLLAAGVLAGVTALALAPQGADAMRGMKMKNDLSKLDQAFVKAVNGGNLAEVAWYPVVTSHAASDAAKRVAQRLRQDHAQSNAELVALCARKGVKLPHEVADDEQAVIDRLKQEKGAAFDAAYRHEMMRDHIRDIEMFEREISIGRDLAVKAYATKTLPMLKEHLQLARNMTSGSAMKTGASSEQQ